MTRKKVLGERRSYGTHESDLQLFCRAYTHNIEVLHVEVGGVVEHCATSLSVFRSPPRGDRKQLVDIIQRTTSI